MHRLVATLCLSSALAGHLQAQCLHVGVQATELTGVVQLITVPGPPNYESVAAGDRADQVFVLELGALACAEGPEPGTKLTQAQFHIDRVQLVPEDDSTRAVLRQGLGKRTTVLGQLDWPISAQHHFALVMFVAKPST